MYKKTYKGVYSPHYPEKYIGDPTNIIYRSRWELLVMKAFDGNSSILKWGSEELIIPYFWDHDQKNHRYFPDFIIFVKTKNDGIKKVIIEIKPYAQTLAPVNKKGKKQKTLLNEVLTFSKNTAKWNAAREYCRKNNMMFLIMTEHHIFPNGKAW